MNSDSSLSTSSHVSSIPKDKFSCKHIEDYKKDPVLNSYRIVHELFVSCFTENYTHKAEKCFCYEDSCESQYKRLHGCLHCAFFGCRGQHIQSHSENHKHPLAIDINSGHVYCFECKDYKYDSDFEEIAQAHNLTTAIQRPPDPENMTKDYKCAPTMKQEAIFYKLYHFRPISVEITGLRGIVNLGNTCYMTVILQSLVHAPVVREYFLSGKHTKTCVEQHSYDSSKTDEVSDLTVCFSCEIGKIVEEFYSGKEEAYIPYRLLRLSWRNFPHLVDRAYDLQDAHEYLLALLNRLHKYREKVNCQLYNSKDHANCIMDKFFTGVTRLERICQECGLVKSSINNFNDISLNLNSNSGESNILTLEGCLERLIEYKDMNYTLSCDNCKVKQNHREKTKLGRLPVVIIFHVNRLSEKNYNDRIVTFPEDLDMTPFVSSCKNDSNSSNVNYNKFYLFAVVQFNNSCQQKTKVRNLNCGHYVCYVRMHNKKWYLCDDTKTESTTFENIKASPANLLFYHKEYLQYNVESILEQIKGS